MQGGRIIVELGVLAEWLSACKMWTTSTTSSCNRHKQVWAISYHQGYHSNQSIIIKEKKCFSFRHCIIFRNNKALTIICSLIPIIQRNCYCTRYTLKYDTQTILGPNVSKIFRVDSKKVHKIRYYQKHIFYFGLIRYCMHG